MNIHSLLSKKRDDEVYDVFEAETKPAGSSGRRPQGGSGKEPPREGPTWIRGSDGRVYRASVKYKRGFLGGGEYELESITHPERGGMSLEEFKKAIGQDDFEYDWADESDYRMQDAQDRQAREDKRKKSLVGEAGRG